MVTPLTPADIEQYREHGYTVARGLLPAKDLERWTRRLEDIVSGTVPPARRMLVMRDVMVAKGVVKPGSEMEAIAKIQDFEGDPVLDSYCTNELVLDCVEQLIGPDLQSIHCMLINKPPGVDGRHPLHQDLVYFPFRPADAIVASWTALEPVTRANGCLVVVPGSHRGELLDHRDVEWDYVNAGYWGAAGVDSSIERVHIECAPGDTIFFHPLLLHGSGHNATTGFRRAISCHYASTRCEKIWDERESDDTRFFRTVRGEAPAPVAVTAGAERPGQPGRLELKGTRRG